MERVGSLRVLAAGSEQAGDFLGGGGGWNEGERKKDSKMLKVYFPWKHCMGGNPEFIREGFNRFSYGIVSNGKGGWYSRGAYVSRKEAMASIDTYLRMCGYYLC